MRLNPWIRTSPYERNNSPQNDNFMKNNILKFLVCDLEDFFVWQPMLELEHLLNFSIIFSYSVYLSFWKVFYLFYIFKIPCAERFHFLVDDIFRVIEQIKTKLILYYYFKIMKSWLVRNFVKIFRSLKFDLIKYFNCSLSLRL